MRLLKKLIPKSFMGRTILLILVPLFCTQIAMTLIFLKTHWEPVQRQMARSVVGEMKLLITDVSRQAIPFDVLQKLYSDQLGVNISIASKKPARPKPALKTDFRVRALYEQLHGFGYPISVYNDRGQGMLYMDISLKDGHTLSVAMLLKRIYSSTTVVFLLWIVLSTIVSFMIILPLVRSHMRSLRNLTKLIMELNYRSPHFQPSGSSETRMIGRAILIMHQRLLREMNEGATHLESFLNDLRPLMDHIEKIMQAHPDMLNKLAKPWDDLRKFVQETAQFDTTRDEVETSFSLTNVVHVAVSDVGKTHPKLVKKIVLEPSDDRVQPDDEILGQHDQIASLISFLIEVASALTSGVLKISIQERSLILQTDLKTTRPPENFLEFLKLSPKPLSQTVEEQAIQTIDRHALQLNFTREHGALKLVLQF